MKQWFWDRFKDSPVVRRLRPRLMTMILALVLPITLICMVVSVLSVIQGRELVDMNSRNAFSLFIDDMVLRYEYREIDPLADFPSVPAQSLQPLLQTVSDFRGSLYVSRDGHEAWEILPDGAFTQVDRDFDAIGQETYHYIWQKPHGAFQVMAAFHYNFPLSQLPAWFWIASVLSVLTVILCPLLYGRLKFDILDPMEVLDQGIEGLKHDLSSRIPAQSLKTSDDFLRLFDEFNAMAQEVQASHDKDVRMLETEMDNLRLQVNPHMLLNSYNMIYALAESKNYEVIQDYTLCLVDYFRYVLRKGQKLVSVGQELEFVDNFIRIQRIRFPGRFSYVYQAEDACLQALIPPLLIENFVENAIKYALNPREAIEIVVSVRRESDSNGREKLLIAITDTGSGIRPQVLEKLKAGEPYIDENGNRHIGIYNCLRRIELFYGEDGEAHFSSGEGMGTQIYLTVPFLDSNETEKNRSGL